MTKVPPYHTDFEEHPAEYRDVYHSHDDCPDGRLILPHHRRSGTGGKPQCKKCAELTRSLTGPRRRVWGPAQHQTPAPSPSRALSEKASISKTRHLLSNLAVLFHASAFWCISAISLGF